MELRLNGLRVLQALGADRNTGYFVERMLANPAPVGEDKVE